MDFVVTSIARVEGLAGTVEVNSCLVRWEFLSAKCIKLSIFTGQLNNLVLQYLFLI